MGTQYHISWVATTTNNSAILAERDRVKSLVDQLLIDFNKSMSTYDPESELSILNTQYTANWQTISKDLYRVLTMAMTGQMVEYIAVAKANLAWIAWREGNLSDAQQNGQAALELWQQISVVYPFQWTALWPLIAVVLAQNQVSEAINYTRSLLDSTQQRLPDMLTAELEETLLKWEEDQPEEICVHLDQAVKLAQEMGYL